MCDMYQHMIYDHYSVYDIYIYICVHNCMPGAAAGRRAAGGGQRRLRFNIMFDEQVQLGNKGPAQTKEG